MIQYNENSYTFWEILRRYHTHATQQIKSESTGLYRICEWMRRAREKEIWLWILTSRKEKWRTSIVLLIQLTYSHHKKSIKFSMQIRKVLNIKEKCR